MYISLTALMKEATIMCFTSEGNGHWGLTSGRLGGSEFMDSISKGMIGALFQRDFNPSYGTWGKL